MGSRLLRVWSRNWIRCLLQWTPQEMRPDASLMDFHGCGGSLSVAGLGWGWTQTDKLIGKIYVVSRTTWPRNPYTARTLRLSTSLPVMSSFCVGVNNLFHSSSSTSLAVGASCLDRCNSIWAYFVENLDDILRLIRVKLGSAVTKHFADPAHVGSSLSDLSPVTPVEAAKKITSVKSKTPSQDILPVVILEKCVDSFAIVITRPTNISFEQAVFTTAFEMAQITLLLKKLIRDPEFPSYYCSPISTPFQR